MIKLNVRVLLKHILDQGQPKLLDSDSEEEGEGGEERDYGTKVHDKPKGDERKPRRRDCEGVGRKRMKLYGANLLDFEGPKLINGCRNWLLLYQILGHINWIGRPFYVSAIFKLFVFILTSYVMVGRFLWKLVSLNIISGQYRNPIVVIITLLEFVVFAGQTYVVIRMNLLNLCPMFKILTTPKLCFLKTDILQTIGDKTLSSMLIFNIYHSTLNCLVVTRSVSEFVHNFYLPTFLLDLYANLVYIYFIIGMSQMDLYIRLAFGHWLMALKSHLELRFTNLHRHQKRVRRLRFGSDMEDQSSADGDVSPDPVGEPHKEPQLRLITFDEIQRNLNNMDDHLEVLRSIQIGSIVFVTLSAFLGVGALILITYHLIANQSDYYHGLLFLLLSVNYIVFVFISYSGDRWIYYTLGSFVQTVEDEYFMQSEIKDPVSPNGHPIQTNERELAPIGDGLLSPLLADLELQQAQQTLLIKKKDVLFCREFLHQFENHLATPWSKLTFKSHLHMLRTFVTLTAAQIIFDHEH